MSILSTLSMLYAPNRQYRTAFKHLKDFEPEAAEPKIGLAQGLKIVDGDLLVDSLTGSPGADPRGWSLGRKAFATAAVTFIALQSTYASAVSSTNINSMVAAFGVGKEAADLPTAIFMWGYAFGSLPAAPLSEVFGRQPVYLATFALASAFGIGTGASQTWAQLLVCRFFAGLFGASPLALAGGTLNDLFTPIHRSYAFPLFAGVAFVSPMASAIIGSSIADLWDWRWNYYLNAIVGLVAALVFFVFFPETLKDRILYEKKQALWEARGALQLPEGVVVQQAHRKELAPGKFARLVLLKSLAMQFSEPLLGFLTFNISVVYFLLFGWLETYPYVYGELHSLEVWQVGLCFFPIFIGVCMGMLVHLYLATRYAKKSQAAKGGGKPLHPENRLEPLLLGSVLMPISLFWFGWTAAAEFSIWASLPSGLLLGLSAILTFIATYQMVIDTYKQNASSALAANVMVRYCVAGGAVMAARPMFKAMSPAWACTLLGCVAVLLLPIAYSCYRWGESLRRMSHYAPYP